MNIASVDEGSIFLDKDFTTKTNPNRFWENYLRKPTSINPNINVITK